MTRISAASHSTTKQLECALDMLRAGELIGLPTETVYGLGADASNPQAVAKIFALKGRPSNHPLIVHVANLGQVEKWTQHMPDYAYALAQAFWPGPLTLILPRASQVLDAVTGGQNTVGIRIPAHPMALALLNLFEGGIAAPSANKFGRISPTTALHVVDEFKTEGGEKLFVLDGGACKVGIESTIVDCTQATPRILRPGQITAAQIAQVTGLVLNQDMAEKPRVSGALAAHYAPHTALFLLDAEHLNQQALHYTHHGKRCAVLSFKPVPKATLQIMMPLDCAHYAAQIYAFLHQVDAQNFDAILLENLPPTDEWSGVRDRLMRAAVGSGSTHS